MTNATQSRVPEKGQLVVVRDRHWVVSEVSVGAIPIDEVADHDAGSQHVVSLISVEDDGVVADLDVVWEVEPGTDILETATLPAPEVGRFDDPARLAAFLDAVRWGAVTSVDSAALQAPFRSGIQIEDYQLDPVVRSLQMPRVNLLVADDVGLGKTIEAGLVIQELLLRHRARTVLVVCPASLCVKWQAEMSEKFGLDFQIVDSAMLRQLRRSRGVGANPFRVHPRLIVSIDWLKRPRAMGLLREVLPASSHTYPRRFDLLVIDEVHQCAPSGRGKYAVDSQRTTAIRAVAPHFEHRLFLSATPHNGYTESFTALMELLDPQRFAVGVLPKPEVLAESIVRRLKDDIVNPDGSRRFAERKIVPLEVDFPDEEVVIHDALRRYTELRREAAIKRGSKGTADLVTLLLKKRLFSSPAAFASTLQLHIDSLERSGAAVSERRVAELFNRLDEEFADDDELLEAEEEAVTAAARADGEVTTEQRELLQQMQKWSALNRRRATAKEHRLIQWVLETCCPTQKNGTRVWNDERVIIFTEYRATQLYLQELFEAAGLGGERLELLYGGMDTDTRERIKGEFQHHPSKKPVRILLATDAASEGIDLQRHCHRLVHIEIPFSPTKLEQRNGRVDRHGQPASEVLIHHFVAKGWEQARPDEWKNVADGSLEADLGFLSLIAKKVDTIRDDIGAAGQVLAEQIEAHMLGRSATPNAAAAPDKGKAARALNKLERDLRDRIAKLRDQLDESMAELRLSPASVQRVVSTALDLSNQPPLIPTTLEWHGEKHLVFEAPQFTRSWASSTRDLYDPIDDVVRPLTFDHELAAGADDVVLAHLNHRLVAQSMRTLRAEIWSSGADVRMGRVSARTGGPGLDDLGVVAYARLVLVGGDGRRLHEEIIAAGGRIRKGSYARWNIGETDTALTNATFTAVGAAAEAHIAAVWPKVVDSVFSALETRAKDRVESLQRRLAEREEADVAAITSVLGDLRDTIGAKLHEMTGEQYGQLTLDLRPEERDQFDRNAEALQRRLDEIPDEIDREVAALRERYATPTSRLFPAAVEFLVPEGGLR